MVFMRSTSVLSLGVVVVDTIQVTMYKVCHIHAYITTEAMTTADLQMGVSEMYHNYVQCMNDEVKFTRLEILFR